MVEQVSSDTRAFREALGSFTTGVTVVTTRGIDGENVGLTANSFNSVSLDPPMVLWSLGKSARSMPHFQAAPYFAVHILAEQQQDLSTRFATRGADKFAGLELARGPGDIPLLEHCAARFVCRTAYQYEGGDHLIFVGEVLEFTHSEKQPLLFHAGQYGQLRKSEATLAASPGGEFKEASLGYLLRYCSHRLLGQLKRELADRQLSVAQYYFLALVAMLGRESREKLLERSAEGDNPPTQEEVDDLIARGLLVEQQGRFELSPAGSRLHLELVAYYKSAEASALSLLDYESRQTLHILLGKVADAFSSPE
jgi:3-hydroxy-9,10-secoandrosta-1,3,5(10)-triene-9,17-dione monooxygenase reductase component